MVDVGVKVSVEVLLGVNVNVGVLLGVKVSVGVFVGVLVGMQLVPNVTLVPVEVSATSSVIVPLAPEPETWVFCPTPNVTEPLASVLPPPVMVYVPE